MNWQGGALTKVLGGVWAIQQVGSKKSHDLTLGVVRTGGYTSTFKGKKLDPKNDKQFGEYLVARERMWDRYSK